MKSWLAFVFLVGLLHWDGAFAYLVPGPITEVSGVSSYNITTNDLVVLVNTTIGVVTINLLDATNASNRNQHFYIVDQLGITGIGNGDTNCIILQAHGSDRVFAQSGQWPININGSFVHIWTDGESGNWLGAL